MLKAEELKILEQIVDLIQSTPMDSYIRSAFSGVPEYAVRNIDDDAAYNPVEERDMWESRFNVESREHDRDKKLLAESQNALKEALRDMDGMRRQIDELTEERDAVAECLDGNNSIMEEMEAEILKLKADIVKFTVDHMTDEQMADLYDRVVKGAN